MGALDSDVGKLLCLQTSAKWSNVCRLFLQGDVVQRLATVDAALKDRDRFVIQREAFIDIATSQHSHPCALGCASSQPVSPTSGPATDTIELDL